MHVARVQEGAVTVIAPSGDIDSRSAPEFQEAALSDLQGGERLLLDLSGVPFVSSAGLRVLLLIHRQAHASKVRVALCGLNPDVRSSMSATGFLSFFTVRTSREEGLAALE
ncbi:MAG: STAS domain-containing protein [Gemmatimonadetes bacterium]|nr:STAS domain-containing protein [Gemmatimonadota bacterium]